MTNEVTIRDYTAADGTAVVDLWQRVLPGTRAWHEPRLSTSRKVAQRDNLFFVAECQQQLAGTVVAGFDGVRGWIYRLAVTPELRRRGIARQLLAHAERALGQLGCPKINLQLLTSNAGTVAFYERCGYSLEDRISMGKPLAVDADVPFDPVPTIELGNGLRLTSFARSDRDTLVEWFNQSSVYHDFMLSIPAPYTTFDADEWLTKALRESLAVHHSRNWAIRSADGQVIGGVGFNRAAPDQAAETGYWLAQPYWGQGLTVRAVRAVVSWAFAECGLHKLFARAYSDNPRSIRVLEKSGFEREGVLRDHLRREGQARDVVYFGIWPILATDTTAD